MSSHSSNGPFWVASRLKAGGDLRKRGRGLCYLHFPGNWDRLPTIYQAFFHLDRFMMVSYGGYETGSGAIAPSSIVFEPESCT